MPGRGRKVTDKTAGDSSIIQGLHSWLNTECAKQNMQLGTERDIYKAETERLSSGFGTVVSQRDDLLSALKAMRDEFRAHDLPYGSAAYAQANTLINKLEGDSL